MENLTLGNLVINRVATLAASNTVIDLNVPASKAGRIYKVNIWPASNMTGVVVGIFRLVVGNTYECTQSQSIVGTVLSGAVRTYDVGFDVEVGDFIGMYWGTGTLENTASGNIASVSGNKVVVDNETVYTPAIGTPSLNGVGVANRSNVARETVDFKIGVPVENNTGIITVNVNDVPKLTPTIESIQSGTDLDLIAPEKFNGKRFVFWRIIKLSGDEFSYTNEFTITIMEDVEIRAVYSSDMFRETVEYIVGPVVDPFVSRFRETVEYTVI